MADSEEKKGFESDREFSEVDVFYRDREPGSFIFTRAHDDLTFQDIKQLILTHTWPNQSIDDPNNRLGLYIREENEDDNGVVERSHFRLPDNEIVTDHLKRISKSEGLAIYRIAEQEVGAQH